MLKIDSKMTWTPELIEQVHDEIMIIAKEELGLEAGVDLYPNQFEMVSAEQMLDAYASVGMPVHYNHWSFGKEYLRNQQAYERGDTGLALEMVINSSPCVNYLMEENLMYEQAMVIAHAACLSGDTEYFSEDGWKRIDQYDGGQVAQAEFLNGRFSINLINPSKYINQPENDYMYNIAGFITEDQVFDNYGQEKQILCFSQTLTKDHMMTFHSNGKIIKQRASNFVDFIKHNKTTEIDFYSMELPVLGGFIKTPLVNFHITKVIPDDNKSYCFTVPSGMLIIRHNGVISFTGNCGHNSVFKNNIYFKEWTNAGNIIDYMGFAKEYIKQCEEKYGEQEVESILDAAHSISYHGIDKFKRKGVDLNSEEARLQKIIKEAEQKEKDFDLIISKTTFKEEDIRLDETLEEYYGEENLLYFMANYSPKLKQWQREILRIVSNTSQYFYPQALPTQVVNEGMASFCHYYIMTRLEEKGILTSDAYMAFLASHSGVIFQPTYDKRYYNGHNPYAIGFAILMDIKRICENPTEEDKRWFPQLIGVNWSDAIKDAAFNYRDDSFIQQFLSPKVIRDFKMFTLDLDIQPPEPREDTGWTWNPKPKSKTKAIVSEIHDDEGYKNIRNILARTKDRINSLPQISVNFVDWDNTRTLNLSYTPYRGRKLHQGETKKVLKHLKNLWGFDVVIN